MIRLTLVLALITLIASLALAVVYEGTAPKIEEQKRIKDELARRTALPEAACGTFVEVKTAEAAGDTFVYYEGYRDAEAAEFVGYVVTAEGKGYSSTIKTVVGVDSAGKITGMKITEQQETPGLGSRIEEVTSTKTVLDAIKELAGRGRPETVSIDIVDGSGTSRCLMVGFCDKTLCGDMENLVAGRDTAAVGHLAPRVFRLGADDSAAVFLSPPLTFDVSKRVIEKLRSEVTPWFLKQFIGKPYGSLVVTVGESEQYIQAITGATISSVAVTESVRKALKRLEAAVGGFKEAAP